jgi:CRISPR/Cas system-associated exonuclease Cas4 (RecB family)
MVEYAGDAIIDGNLVGDYARNYFLKKLDEQNFLSHQKRTAISFEHFAFKEALVQTQQQIKNSSEIKYLFEAAFQADDTNLKTRCDILELKANKHVNLYEVKATSKFKKEHFFDVVYQIYILRKNGFIVDEVFLMTLNPNYLYGANQEVNLKKMANQVYDQFSSLTYEEVLQEIKENNLLLPFTNEPQADLDSELIFDFHDQ